MDRRLSSVNISMLTYYEYVDLLLLVVDLLLLVVDLLLLVC
jgi:hypothetical protein